jgi:hypothetical protein
MIYEYEEQWWNDIYRGKLKKFKKNLSQCHFVHNEPTWTDPGRNQGLLCESLTTNRLSHTSAIQRLRTSSGLFPQEFHSGCSNILLSALISDNLVYFSVF